MTAGVAMSVIRSPGPRWWAAVGGPRTLPGLGAALAAALVGCTTPPDPCGDAETCVTIDVDSFLIRTIDQLELDLVYGNVHTTTTTGTRGTSLELPVSTALILNLPGPLIEVTFVAAARLNGAVLGADAGRIDIQSGHRSSTSIDLSRVDTCVEGAIYCDGVGSFLADFQTLYQCDHGVPLYYARCASACKPTGDPGGVCYGTGGLCRDAGTYCGGHMIDGDPFTLYVCKDFDGTQPRKCPNGCLVRSDGDDVCQ